MASSSSHNNNGIPFATLLEWYKIRDLLVGDNFALQDVLLAILLARECDHPDARWLSSVCAGRDFLCRDEAFCVFVSLGDDDARALCFASQMGDESEICHEMLKKSAKMGYAWAQARLAARSEAPERFEWAKLAALQGERDGFSELGVCYELGWGCEKDLKKAQENFLLSVEHESLSNLQVVDASNPKLFKLLIARDAASLFLTRFSKQVEDFLSGTGNASTVFVIGRGLRGRVGLGTILGDSWNFNSLISPASKAIAFYEFQLRACRKAVDHWTLVGIRFSVVRDIRKLIAKLIWESREEALYKDVN
jgi:hypothetical protein